MQDTERTPQEMVELVLRAYDANRSEGCSHGVASRLTAMRLRVPVGTVEKAVTVRDGEQPAPERRY